MSYKTILVSLNDLERNQLLLDSAAGLARSFGAFLLGVYIVPAIEVYATFGLEPVIFEGNRDLFQKAEKSVRATFDTVLKDAGIHGDIKVIDSTSPAIAGDFVDCARRSDITIVNQPSENTALSVVDRDFVERVLLSTGRPTLVLPRSGRTDLAANLAVIGWSGKREAARAVFDSLPLLKKARKVKIVWVDPEMEYPHPGGLPGAELAETLSRHGIDATVEPISTGGREAGETLLTAVADSGAELLVMGAYGHSRLSEMILGGATRSVLKDMKCPVLFSH
jgi:nucleotide-binding universal stress UspA family protein